jgi:hypothetical protein
LQSMCWLSIPIVNAFFYVPGEINKMKEPLSSLRMAVESASSGSATGKILFYCECTFSIFCSRFFIMQCFRASYLFWLDQN